MSDFLIATAIAAPLVLSSVLWFLWSVHRAERGEARALSARLRYPACGLASLVWAEAIWTVEELYDDREESYSGFVFRCRQCGGTFDFTREGDRFHRE